VTGRDAANELDWTRASGPLLAADAASRGRASSIAGEFASLSEIGALAAAESVASPTSTAAATTSAVPTHDPPLVPRDEATFLLHIAAEIEHALMVQYLYAGYSLDPQAAGLSSTQSGQVANWKRTVLSIAKEEMGHFISVQNILISLGAPLNFAREAYPFRSAFYPFEFKLEPLTIKRRKPLAAAVKASKNDPQKIERALFSASLNRYIAAEMPALELVPAADQELVKSLTQGEEVNRVGLLFKRLLDLFDAGSHGGLVDADFDAERLDAQGHEQEWGGADTETPFEPLVRPVKTRAEARALLAEIAEQGEGHQEGALTSHFQRFLAIYRELEQFPPKQTYLHAVAANPSTTEETGTAITNPRTRAWAQLLNLRYRLLLGYLWHFLSVGGDRFAPNGDRTAHGWLVAATFYEMSHVKELSELLVGLDLDTTGASKAGPPFELPYGLTLPEREKDRFRRHLDVLSAARRLALTLETTLAAGASGAEKERAILAAMAERDALASAELDQLRQGLTPPLVTGFAKVRRILDEALRGFPLARTGHDEFWRVDEEQFPAAAPAGFPAVTPGDGANSNLVKALRGEAPFGSDLGAAGAFLRRMPAGRAPVDPTRIAFIEQWIDALQAADPTDPALPSNGTAPMGRYQEIIDILDAAVGGSASPVGAHGAFWRGKTRDQFVAASVFGQKLLITGDGAGSNLVKALLGETPFGTDLGAAGGIFRRMPAGRPAVPAASVEVIKTWIDDNCPD
jgi:rubrerythrin